jgi:hypothetical protein
MKIEIKTKITLREIRKKNPENGHGTVSHTATTARGNLSISTTPALHFHSPFAACAGGRAGRIGAQEINHGRCHLLARRMGKLRVAEAETVSSLNGTASSHSVSLSDSQWMARGRDGSRTTAVATYLPLHATAHYTHRTLVSSSRATRHKLTNDPTWPRGGRRSGSSPGGRGKSPCGRRDLRSTSY